MLANREELLRIARIIDYNRYYIPTVQQTNEPLFDYEYVQFVVYEPLDTGGYCMTGHQWKKARRNSPYNPNIEKEEMERKIKYSEVRARKEMKTSELRTMLETLPLRFVFEDGMDVVVLTKLTDYPHKVYIKWDASKEEYVEQYAIKIGSEIHKNWFNKERKNSPEGQDWRFLLNLNPPDSKGLNTDVLYKYFEGVYTGNLDKMEEGTELYFKEHGGSIKNHKKLLTKTSLKRIKDRLHTDVKGQEKVCIKDPNNNIIRLNKHYVGRYLKMGWVYASKEEYKAQQKEKFKKRKEMAKDNIQEQMQMYKGPKDPIKPKGIPGSPYERYQTIKILPKELTETFKIRILSPIYEYQQVENTELYIRIFKGRKEEFITVTRKTPIRYKTIKVLQIPSNKTKELKALFQQTPKPKEGETPLLPVIREYSKRYGVKDGRYKKYFLEKEDIKKPTYEDYLVIKRDGHGNVVNIIKRKLVK